MSTFLSVAGLAGDSLDAKHKGWYDVENYQFSVNAPEGSKAQFSAVTIDFASDAALTKMMDFVASQKFIPGMTLETTDPLNNKIYTLDLASARISGITDLPFGGFSVEISYAEIDIETIFQDPVGKFYSEDPFRWDLANNKEGPALGPFAPVAGSTAVGNASDYFLLIDGMNGGVTNKGYEGWFQIEYFNFDVSAPPGGKASFSDVTIEMTGDTGLTALLKMAASGQVIKGARIEGVFNGGSGLIPVYDLTIGEIRIADIKDLGADSDPQGFSITFDYGLVETKVFDSVSSKFMTSSYDLTKAAPNATMPAIAVSPTQSPTDAATQFFLAMPGVQGDSTVKGHEGWIEVLGVNYDLTTPPAGKTDFSLVNLALASDTPITGLFSALVEGNNFAGATIHGVNSLNKTVFELNLDDVLVSSLNESQNGYLQLNLAYDQIEVGTWGTLNNGTIAANPVFGWDLTKNATANIASVGPGSKAPDVAATDYFMLIDGLSGSSTDAKHANWFDILDFSLNVGNSATPGSVGSGGAGNPAFSKLTVVVDDQAALTSLLGYAANGKASVRDQDRRHGVRRERPDANLRPHPGGGEGEFHPRGPWLRICRGFRFRTDQAGDQRHRRSNGGYRGLESH
ncbi:MAG: type VI secretion system tube protein Hcp [Rhizobiales bacterium]|nr:type VI secretion system tube protein Hcp [Hyphomicrobiales bacterium]